MISALYVFLGGGLGSLTRYGVTALAPVSASHYGTLLSNAIACFILGVLLSLHGREILQSHHKLLLATGFCGGFSTFSTFSGELVQLGQNGAIPEAILYGALSIVIGIAGILLGLWATRWMM